MLFDNDTDYIVRRENKYIIEREINGKNINFGTFDNLKDALLKRDELEYNGWPISISKNKNRKIQQDTSNKNEVIKNSLNKKYNDKSNLLKNYAKNKQFIPKTNKINEESESKNILSNNTYKTDKLTNLDIPSYRKYIFRKNDKFYVNKLINDELRIFGSFDSKNEAMQHVRELISNNWINNNKFNYDNRNIKKIKDMFVIQKEDENHKLQTFGYYNTLKNARKARDQFESEEWKKHGFPEVVSYVYKVGEKYQLINKIHGIEKYFGVYDNLIDAVLKRNELIKNNWEDPVKSQEKSKENQKIIPNNHNLKEKQLVSKINKYNNVKENIKKESDSRYIVYRHINGNLDERGPYTSLSDARKAKKNLESNGWESDTEYSSSKYGKYVYKTGKDFHVKKQIKGKNIDFGSFEKLAEAVQKRDQLVYTNWGKYNIKPKNNKNRYISKTNNGFTVSKTINGKLIVFGYYHSRENAREARDQFEFEKWKKPMHIEVFSNIYKIGDKYRIEKRMGNKLRTFGIYDSYTDALNKRNKLDKNDWQNNKVDNKKIQNTVKSKSDKNKHLVKYGQEYRIYKLIDHELEYFGTYETIEEAIKERKKLEDNNWRKENQKSFLDSNNKNNVPNNDLKVTLEVAIEKIKELNKIISDLKKNLK